MKIIRAAEKHLTELAALQKMYMEHHAKLDDYFTFEEDASTLWIEYMKKFLKEKNNIALIALEKQTFIGYMTASIYTRRPIYKIRKVGLTGDNFVLPNYRRKGVFSKMLEKTLSWMKTKGVEYVEHPIAAKNKLGRTAWRKKGFENMTIVTKRKIT
ncbi:MAG: GNAT family N-acetyltransferase [Candidatus Bathyarchaeia archaeon]|jgi:GNAT superfamily N-acetyltransferase